MRILFISREYPPETGGGGIGSYVADAAPGLAALGHDVHVLSCSPGQAISTSMDSGVTIHRRPRKALSGIRRVVSTRSAERMDAALSAALALRSLDLRPDVIEVPDWLGEGLLVSRLSRYPTVAHLHTPFRLITEFAGDDQPTPRVADWIERHAVSSTDLVTSPSRLLVSALRARDWLEAEEVEIVRYPVDWRSWASTRSPHEAPPTAVVMGRVEPRKNQLLAVEAVAHAGVDGARLVVLGREAHPGYAALVRQRAAELGVHVEWAGQCERSELPRRLDGARVVLVPSVFESFGMVVTEAMSAGRPVLASDMTGAAELINDGQNGERIPVDVPTQWGDRLRRYFIDGEYATEVGGRAAATVRDECDPERIARARVGLFERVLGDGLRHGRRSKGPPTSPPPS